MCCGLGNYSDDFLGVLLAGQRRCKGEQQSYPGQVTGPGPRYHCNRRPIRNERAPLRSPVEPLFTPTLVMTPTPVGSVMSVPGLLQFGWLKTLTAVISQRRRAPLSVK